MSCGTFQKTPSRNIGLVVGDSFTLNQKTMIQSHNGGRNYIIIAPEYEKSNYENPDTVVDYLTVNTKIKFIRISKSWDWNTGTRESYIGKVMTGRFKGKKVYFYQIVRSPSDKLITVLKKE